MKNPIRKWRTKAKYQHLGKTGKIVSFTKVNNPPAGFGNLPYYVGVIKIAKEQITSQLVVEGEKPAIGKQVKGILRIIGQAKNEEIINYGVKFKVI
jgi:uncharacterized OB-fold protein